MTSRIEEMLLEFFNAGNLYRLSKRRPSTTPLTTTYEHTVSEVFIAVIHLDAALAVDRYGSGGAEYRWELRRSAV